MAIRIAGTTDYNRKDNRVETSAFVSFEGETYQVLDIGLGGFRIDGYDGELMPGQEFLKGPRPPLPAALIFGNASASSSIPSRPRNAQTSSGMPNMRKSKRTLL